MRINERFSIEKDPCNFIVRETTLGGINPRTGKKSKRARIDSKFYPNLELACLSILRKSTDVETLETILKSQGRAVDDIVAALKANRVAL